MGAGVSISGVKRPGGEVEHSPTLSVEVKNERSTTFTHPACLHEQGQVFIFTLEGFLRVSFFMYLATSKEYKDLILLNMTQCQKTNS